MKTIDKINIQGQEIMAKLIRGKRLLNDEWAILKIYNNLHSKKASNSGKRNDKHYQQTGR